MVYDFLRPLKRRLQSLNEVTAPYRQVLLVREMILALHFDTVSNDHYTLLDCTWLYMTVVPLNIGLMAHCSWVVVRITFLIFLHRLPYCCLCKVMHRKGTLLELCKCCSPYCALYQTVFIKILRLLGLHIAKVL